MKKGDWSREAAEDLAGNVEIEVLWIKILCLGVGKRKGSSYLCTPKTKQVEFEAERRPEMGKLR